MLPTSDDGFLLGMLLQLPYATLNRRLRQGYAAAGFTDLRPSHEVIFRFLSPEGNRITDLAARAGATKQAVSNQVAYLVQRGYLERAPDPTDRRALLVRRTERGWAVNRIARCVAEQMRAEWASQLGEEPVRQLLERLQVLADLVEEQPL